MKYLKIALFTFNLLIWLAGCITLVIGAWLLLEPSKGHLLNLFVADVTPQETIHLLAYSLLGLGVTVLTVGFFGCRASLHENQCNLAIYISMLLALIVTELVTAAVGALIMFPVISRLEERLLERFRTHYGHDTYSDSSFSKSLDYAQYKFNCCGVNGDADYNNTHWASDKRNRGFKIQVPLTCCVLRNAESDEDPWVNPKPRDEAACQVDDEEGHESYRHKEGCLQKVRSWLQNETFKIVFLVMAMAGVQTTGIITSAFLCRAIRDMDLD